MILDLRLKTGKGEEIQDSGFKIDGFVKSPSRCHCEEQSDAAISVFQVLTHAEIASLRSQ